MCGLRSALAELAVGSRGCGGLRRSDRAGGRGALHETLVATARSPSPARRLPPRLSPRSGGATRQPPSCFRTIDAITMKFTLSWLKDHLDTDGLARRDRRDADAHRARGRGRRGPGQGAGAPSRRLCDRRPSSIPNADRLRVCMVDTGAGDAGPGRLRRAECAHRHEVRLRAARHLHSGQEHHARRRHDPRRREPRHARARRRSSSSPTTTTASSTCRTTRRSAQPYAAYAGLDDPVIEINLTPNRPDCTSVVTASPATSPRPASAR